MIAQRISTVLNADQILVLDKGRIVARGTHAELLESSEIYAEIYSSQLVDDSARLSRSNAATDVAGRVGAMIGGGQRDWLLQQEARKPTERPRDAGPLLAATSAATRPCWSSVAVLVVAGTYLQVIDART